jgi:hypothetical protein
MACSTCTQLEEVIPDVDHHTTHLDACIHFKEEKYPRLIIHKEFYGTWLAVSKIRPPIIVGYPTCR